MSLRLSRHIRPDVKPTEDNRKQPEASADFGLGLYAALELQTGIVKMILAPNAWLRVVDYFKSVFWQLVLWQTTNTISLKQWCPTFFHNRPDGQFPSGPDQWPWVSAWVGATGPYLATWRRAGGMAWPQSCCLEGRTHGNLAAGEQCPLIPPLSPAARFSDLGSPVGQMQ